MTARLYGIKACDTMKRAREWLEARGVAYEFIDYRAVGADRATLEDWVARLGWEAVLNRNGTTFRKLPEARKQDIDAPAAVALMLEQPSMIKRPMLEQGETLLAGFKPEIYARELG